MLLENIICKKRSEEQTVNDFRPALSKKIKLSSGPRNKLDNIVVNTALA